MTVFNRKRILVTTLAVFTPMYAALACASQVTGDDDSSNGGTGLGSGGTQGPGTGGAVGVGGSAAVGTGGSVAATGGTGVGGAVSAGTTGAGAPPVTGGTAGAGVGVGGATAGASGTATAGSAGTATMPVQKLCATKVTVTTPLLTNFETYDGVMPATGTGSWTFTIGTAYAGFYPLSEPSPPGSTTQSPTYVINMVAGANASNWAVHAANPTTADWGGGIGIWMGCINASAYTGLSFYVRGTTPNSMINVSIATEDTSPPDAANPAGGGTCDPAPAAGCSGPHVEVPITADWTLVSLPWGMFTAGVGAGEVMIPATGDKITGLSISAEVVYAPNPADDGGTYIPNPGAFDLAVDDIGFSQ